jgi:4-alpha-glucanotransferase
LLAKRRGGVLCNITSLPGAGATGTLGDAALRFLDFMQHAGLSIWQMLPLNPPDEYGSPYHSASLFALDEALLDPALHLDAPAALLRYARARSDAFDRFTTQSAYWLDDYCRFCVGRDRFGPDWSTWPVALRWRGRADRATALHAVRDARRTRRTSARSGRARRAAVWGSAAVSGVRERRRMGASGVLSAR